jgi:predicted RNA binding protein YcfA (HicA-like mRNA interferase family)
MVPAPTRICDTAPQVYPVSVSPRAPRLTAAELLRALRRDGWYEHHATGSHVQLKHATKSGRVTVPRHASVVLKPKTLLAILDQAGLTVDRLRDLM